MAKKSKRRPVVIKIATKPVSPASVYGSMLARQVAAEMTPARSPRKKTGR